MISPAITQTVVRLVSRIVPEADVSILHPHRSFHDQFEIDSIDYLNLMLALETAFQITIGELDYPKLSTLHGCVEYLAERLHRLDAWAC